MSDSSAPHRAELILEAFGADTDFRETVIGDLAEEYALRVGWDGPVAARRWYYRESVRVAPYLLRDWWRGLRRNDVAYFARVLVLSSLSVTALEWILQNTVRGFVEPAVGILPAFMLLWTMIDGAFGGYVAARLGRRAPLPIALMLGVTLSGVILLSAVGTAIPLWFRAANAAAMMAGTFAGAVIRACTSSARRGARLARPL